jgi:mannitol-1-phosphate 5-dehydrogenase
MLQAASILLRKYPNEFTLESLTEHVDDLLIRFQNKTLGDTLFRVGCDLSRKLGAEDRLAGAIHAACDFNLPYDLILYSLVCGCHFNATDESGRTLQSDREFMIIYSKGIKTVMTSICGFDEVVDSEIIMRAVALDDILKSSL